MSFFVENNTSCLTVSALNKQARCLLENHFGTVWVEGEISNFKAYASGHWYFSLKDDKAQIRCAMFKGSNQYVKFNVADGSYVRLAASVSIYEGRGDFQLIVKSLEPAGEGELQKAFEALKKRLHAQGLFDNQYKKPLPLFIERIGIITSQNGAAIRDILTTLKRRSIGQKITIYACEVQGKTASDSIRARLEQAISDRKSDVIILARGGGSLEDLWCFNDELLAKSIFDSPIPIITGIGHEIDFTIADFVADVRAATPTAAAELSSPDPEALMESILNTAFQMQQLIQDKIYRAQVKLDDSVMQLSQFKHRLRECIFTLDRLSSELRQSIRIAVRQALRLTHEYSQRIHKVRPNYRKARSKLNHLHQGLRHAEFRLIREKEKSLAKIKYYLNTKKINTHTYLQKISESKRRMHYAALHRMNSLKQTIMHKTEILTQVSPELILKKGYSIVRDKQGKILSSTQSLSQGDAIEIKLYKGQLNATIDKKIS